jgi:hypothetical protein
MKKTEKKIEEKDPKENFYQLIFVDHYHCQEKTILITNDYDKVLKRFLKGLVDHVNPIPNDDFACWYSKILENGLDGITSWEDFFKLVDQSSEIVEFEDSFYVDIYNGDKNIKTISEYELLKEIYNNDRKSLEKIPFCMDGN